MLPPKLLVARLLVEPNEDPADKLKVFVLTLLSAAPNGDLNAGGGLVAGVVLLPNEN